MGYNPTIKPLAAILATQRSTTGTVINAAGNIETVAADTARIDYSDGQAALLIENAATNLCKAYAAPTTTANTTNTTLVDDPAALAAAGLSGIVTSGKVYRVDNSAGVAALFGVIDGAQTAGVVSTGSAYARLVSGTGSNVVRAEGDAANQSANIVSTGFTRYATLPSTPTGSARLQIRVDVGCVVDFVLPQLETGKFATSYIPTAGAAVTRASDVCTVDVSALGVSSALTLGIKGTLLGNAGTFDRAYQLDNGNNLNRITAFYDSAAGQLAAQAFSGGVAISSSFPVASAATAAFAIGFRLSAAANRACINGALTAEKVATGVYTPPTILRLGHATGALNIPARLRIKSFLLYPAALSDAALTTLGTL
jgi:hypothetical protein